MNDNPKIMHMRSLKITLQALSIVSMLAFSTVFISCNDDDGDDPLPPSPRIELSSEAASLERGGDIEIGVTVTAEGGIRTLTVNGDDLTFTADPNNSAVSTAIFPITVPNDAPFEMTDYVFTVVDNRDQDASATFRLTVIGSTIDLSGTDITENTTFAAENIYIFDTLEVTNNAVLTIPAGTRLYAKSPFGPNEEEFSEFRIDEGAQLIAQGTATNPIVFSTESALNGQVSEPGDWIGVRIQGEPGVSSGSIAYVRVEYGGTDNAPFRLDNVDVSTTVNHIQSFRSGGDGFDIRGGDVNVSNIVVTDAEEISLQVRSRDAAYTGKLQFVIVNTPNILEKENSDGDEVRDFQYRTLNDGVSAEDMDLVISNLTMIGPGRDNGDLSAARIDENFNYQIYNSIIAEYSDDGIRIDYNMPNYDVEDNTIDFSYIFQIGDDPTRDDQDPDSMPLLFETDDVTYSNVIDADNTPTAAAGIGVGDYVPDATITSAFDPTTLNGTGESFFQAGSYVGAIGATDWTLGWTLNADGTPRE